MYINISYSNLKALCDCKGLLLSRVSDRDTYILTYDSSSTLEIETAVFYAHTSTFRRLTSKFKALVGKQL